MQQKTIKLYVPSFRLHQIMQDGIRLVHEDERKPA